MLLKKNDDFDVLNEINTYQNNDKTNTETIDTAVYITIVQTILHIY